MAKRIEVTKKGVDGKPTFLDPPRTKKKNNSKKEKRVKSVFGEWFKLQFGKRPSNDEIHILRENVERCRHALFRAEGLLAECQLWDQRKTASHYAWVAREMILNEQKGTCSEEKPNTGTRITQT